MSTPSASLHMLDLAFAASQILLKYHVTQKVFHSVAEVRRGTETGDRCNSSGGQLVLTMTTPSIPGHPC